MAVLTVAQKVATKAGSKDLQTAEYLAQMSAGRKGSQRAATRADQRAGHSEQSMAAQKAMTKAEPMGLATAGSWVHWWVTQRAAQSVGLTAHLTAVPTEKCSAA